MTQVHDRHPLGPFWAADEGSLAAQRRAAHAEDLGRIVQTVDQPCKLDDFIVAWAAEARPGSQMSAQMITSICQLGPEVLTENGVTIWCGRPAAEDGEMDLARLLYLLSPEERRTAARFRFPDDRWSFVAVHSALRLMLGQLLGCDGSEVRFVSSDKGKPSLDQDRHLQKAARAVHFNIAHTRGMVAIIVANVSVGIDVERVRPLSDMRVLVSGLMAPEAMAAYDAAQDCEDRCTLFFRNWTLSEAFIKATGEGVGQGLSSFAFTQHGKPRLLRTDAQWGPGERWTFGQLAGPSRGAHSNCRAAA
ncbi:4'-phosphopantetheinyl transferase superfamily protein [Novosphingobium sp.]|uniref:4'-phosphopantetheinyl transferase family protein n=1 Tax=Novosphingobium sp. TaxID=1874826 RepID=UPI0025D9C713|nr:4'-phosphopantetheinyl transferase superfamily protein [Novosphingobium sp.]